MYSTVNVLNAIEVHFKVVSSMLCECHLIKGHSHSLRKDRHVAGPQKELEAGTARPLGGSSLLLSIRLRHALTRVGTVAADGAKVR